MAKITAERISTTLLPELTKSQKQEISVRTILSRIKILFAFIKKNKTAQTLGFQQQISEFLR
jgi:hypothetical protein